MPLRLALELVDPQGHGLCVILPDEVHARPLRVGYRGDVELPLPGEITIAVRRGRVLVASERHEIPATLGGMRLPAWPVPVPVPCALAIGACEIRLHALAPGDAPAAIVRRASQAPPPPAAFARRPPPYLADRVLLATVDLVTRASRAVRKEWRLARPETKIAFGTVLLTAVFLATRFAP